jgi:hypothetical protein
VAATYWSSRPAHVMLPPKSQRKCIPLANTGIVRPVVNAYLAMVPDGFNPSTSCDDPWPSGTSMIEQPATRNANTYGLAEECLLPEEAKQLPLSRVRDTIACAVSYRSGHRMMELMVERLSLLRRNGRQRNKSFIRAVEKHPNSIYVC